MNQQFRQADTWALGRTTYETIVPWWDKVAAREVPDDAPPITAADREFAALQKNMTKVVFSTTLTSADDRIVIGGDVAGKLEALKQQSGKDIFLSCGPATLAPIASTPGLVDEYLLTLELADSKVFSGGALVLRYRVVPDQAPAA